MRLVFASNYDYNYTFIIIITIIIITIQSKAFERSTKRALQLLPLSSTFFHSSNIASNECWELNFFRNHP